MNLIMNIGKIFGTYWRGNKILIELVIQKIIFKYLQSKRIETFLGGRFNFYYIHLIILIINYGLINKKV